VRGTNAVTTVGGGACHTLHQRSLKFVPQGLKTPGALGGSQSEDLWGGRLYFYARFNGVALPGGNATQHISESRTVYGVCNMGDEEAFWSPSVMGCMHCGRPGRVRPLPEIIPN